MTLRAARILSSETDNTIKQEQNVNIKITQKPQQKPSTVPPMNPNINFTPMDQSRTSSLRASPSEAGQTLNTPMNQMNSQYVYQPPINNPSLLTQDRGTPLVGKVERSFADLGIELEEMDKKIDFYR